MGFRLFFLQTALSPALLAAMLVSGQALATGTEARLEIFNAAQTVSDDELAGMRGGFFTAAGAQFDFGASIQTMVDGKLALQTNLQWTPAGPVTQQLTGLGAQIQSQVNNTVARNLAAAGIASPLVSTPSVTTPTASPAAASVPVSGTPASSSATNAPSTSVVTSVPGSSLANTVVAQATTPTPTDPVAAAPSASPVTAAAATPSSASPAITTSPGGGTTLSGIQIPGQGGSTQLFANFGGGQIQNIIVNSASGQTITQNTNINLTIYNFQAWQAQMANQLVAARLATDMMAASGFSAGH